MPPVLPPTTSKTLHILSKRLSSTSPVLVMVPIVVALFVLLATICLCRKRKQKRQKRYFSERKASVRRSRILEARTKGAESFVTTTTEGSYGMSIPSITVQDEQGEAVGIADGSFGREQLERIEEVEDCNEEIGTRKNIDAIRESRIRVLAGEVEKENGGFQLEVVEEIDIIARCLPVNPEIPTSITSKS